jgi:ABC-type transporter Mla maintaining outer membrane lipid asymmetry permease subunit MlaE
MSQTLVEKTAEHIAETTRQASRATDAIGHAIEDGVGVMRRAVKHSGDAAEEFLDDTTKRLERHLILTVAITLAVGIFSGAVFGWMAKRK